MERPTIIDLKPDKKAAKALKGFAKINSCLTCLQLQSVQVFLRQHFLAPAR